MVKCPECEKELKDNAGLSGHLRMVHGQSGKLSESVPADLLERIGAALEHLDGGRSSELEELRKEVEAASEGQGEVLKQLEEQLRVVASSTVASRAWEIVGKLGVAGGVGYLLVRMLSAVEENKRAK